MSEGLINMKAFQINESDTVAAYTLEEAKQYYRKITGLSDDDAFYDYEARECSLDELIWDDEERTKQKTLREAIDQYWEGEPFIVCTTEF